MDIKQMVQRYENNPYGLGCDGIDTTESNKYAILSFESKYDRDKVYDELLSKGINKNSMKKNKPIHNNILYKYEIILFY